METRHPHYHITNAKILTHANFMDLRHPRQNFELHHPRQNFMDPRHPPQNFNPCHFRHFFDKNFIIIGLYYGCFQVNFSIFLQNSLCENIFGELSVNMHDFQPRFETLTNVLAVCIAVKLFAFIILVLIN